MLHCGAAGEGWLLVDAAARPSGLVGYYLERARAGGAGRARPRSRRVDGEETIQVMFGGSAGGDGGASSPPRRGARAAARIERTVYPATGVALLDVLHPAVGKAEALSFLQERWGIAAPRRWRSATTGTTAR